MNYLFTIKGTVKKGKQRGKGLGFPTMNISLVQKIPEGVYVSQMEYLGQKYNSLTFIGIARTYHDTNFQAETYILNFDKDMYGQNITVNLLKKLRANQKFDKEVELIEQMKKDRQDAEIYFKNI